MKNLTVILIISAMIVSLGVLGWLKFKPQNADISRIDSPPIANPIEDTVNTTTTIEVESTEDWKTITNLEHIFNYPKDATAEAREEESLVYFMGQKQIDSGRTQTELFDGYSFRIGKITGNTSDDLEQIAIGERDNAVENCNYENGKVSDLLPLEIDGKEGFQYSATGCYIDYTETIIASDESFYRVSQSYVGDEEDYAGYKSITDKILLTLKFLK